MRSNLNRYFATVALLAAGAGVGLAQSATGPEIGQKIPDFTLHDQSGRLRDFESLAGDQGLLLLFSRSADW